MLITVRDEDGTTLATMALKDCTFSTGSRGYRGQEKVTALDGKRYQVQIQAVQIGTKNGH